MSTIAKRRPDHHDGRSLDGLRRIDHRPTQPGSLSLRTRVALHRHGLTRALAEGADPTARPELAVRAAQLTSERNRRGVARTLCRVIAEAHEPPINPFQVAFIRRPAVLEAQDAIGAMIERLRSPRPVCAEGMAMAERIITNADCSPLYNPSEPSTLRRQILVATAALDPHLSNGRGS
jgi:hypothetical protein